MAYRIVDRLPEMPPIYEGGMTMRQRGGYLARFRYACRKLRVGDVLCDADGRALGRYGRWFSFPSHVEVRPINASDLLVDPTLNPDDWVVELVFWHPDERDPGRHGFLRR